MTGVLDARTTLAMASVLEAAVLSVGIKITSELSQADWVTEDTSLLSVKENSVQVRPAAVSSLVTSSTWYLLLASLEQNRRPTFLALGNSSCSMAAC